MGATLNEEDLALLSGTRGKKLKWIEHTATFDSSACLEVRLVFGRSALRLTCFWEMGDLFGEEEELNVFRLAEDDAAVPFYPDNPETQARRRLYLVNGTVRSAEVVRERALYPGDGTSFEMDVTIALRTDNGTVSFSRENYSSMFFSVRRGDPADVDVSWIQPASATWPHNDSVETPLEITREVIRL